MIARNPLDLVAVAPVVDGRFMDVVTVTLVQLKTMGAMESSGVGLTRVIQQTVDYNTSRNCIQTQPLRPRPNPRGLGEKLQKPPNNTRNLDNVYDSDPA
eukprot:SAG31_NODE_14136_length_825_cov_1.561983_1_plen_99_part_00